MRIEQIEFTGLISNKAWHEITGPEFFNALARCGWKEGRHGNPFLPADAQARAVDGHLDASAP